MTVININKENLQTEAMRSSIPVLFDFWASWCAPCCMMAPSIEEIARERGEITVGKVNVDEQPELASAFGVLLTPCCSGCSLRRCLSRTAGASTARWKR